MRITSLFASGLLGLLVATAHAADYKAGSVVIADPWSRATPKGASVAGGYMKITNTGTTPDRLVAGSSEVASGFAVHEMSMAGGVAKMRPVQGGLEIKPGETVELKPGSYHVMFTGLNKPLRAGEHFGATLTFEKAGKVDVNYDVRAAGATAGKEMPRMNMRDD
jgi:copper(I)-binding protein